MILRGEDGCDSILIRSHVEKSHIALYQMVIIIDNTEGMYRGILYTRVVHYTTV